MLAFLHIASFKEGRLSDSHPSKAHNDIAKQISKEDNSQQHTIVCLDRIRKIETMVAELANKPAEIPIEKDRVLLQYWDRIKHIEFDLTKTKKVTYLYIFYFDFCHL